MGKDCLWLGNSYFFFGETEASVESKSQREIIVDLTYQSNWDNRYVSYMSNCCDREK